MITIRDIDIGTILGKGERKKCGVCDVTCPLRCARKKLIFGV